MSILLTGHNGFLGKILLSKFIKNIELDIYTCSRSKQSTYIIDLTDNVPDFDASFDIVIHAAGKAHFEPKTDIDILSFHLVNVLGTKNLLAGLKKCLPKKLVFISSVSVYGLSAGRNINEDCPLFAEDPYGKSKLDAEEIVKEWCDEHNIICTILRLPLVVGLNPPGNLGEMIRGIRKGFYFNIACGTARKSMVLASDIANYIFKVAEVGGTYNLTDGYHPNFFELSNCISNQIGIKNLPNMPMFMAKILAYFGDIIGPKFPINSKKLYKITSTLTYDDTKSRKAFGWNPTPVLSGFKIDE